MGEPVAWQPYCPSALWPENMSLWATGNTIRFDSFEAEEVYARDDIIVVIGGEHLADIGFLVFQPVGFEAEQDGDAARGLFGLQITHFLDVFLEGGGEVFAVFHGVVVAQRAGGVFGEALDGETLGLTGFEHFAHGVAGMGMIGMGMEIDAYHGRSLLS